jgi:hypothetical protein
VKRHAFATAVAVLVAASGCGGSEPEYQQARTAECLRERGFFVRVGPQPTELTVYARHWTGTSHYRIGVLRFYESSEHAEQAIRQSRPQIKENARNVLADVWLRAEDWRSCLTEA